MRYPALHLAIVISATVLLSEAQAAVTISSAATANMTCSGGVCAPTAKNAVLNVGDLETLLASGNVTVTTTGTGVQANDIDVKAALSWSSVGALSLLANKSVTIDEPVSITGLSSLTIQTGGTNGAFSFGKKGNVTFANLSSVLSINGAAYTLVGDLKTLASDTESNPGGNFALANSYDASEGGSYAVDTTFTGMFEGLGNAISNLTLTSEIFLDDQWLEGLFANVGTGGVIENVTILHANVSCTQKEHQFAAEATLVGVNIGVVRFSHATGTVTVSRGPKYVGGLVGRDPRPGGVVAIGGLVGLNEGTISNVHAATRVSAIRGETEAGGLVGTNDGTVSHAFATGAVSGFYAGGLIGDSYGMVSESYATGHVQVIANPQNHYAWGGGLVGGGLGGTIGDSYATGAVTATSGAKVGGLVGVNDTSISSSYSTGAVSDDDKSLEGGLIGQDQAQPGSITDSYWDTDTSGQNQGVGNIANDPGVTGLTTAQFQSGLPAGFDPTIWAEKSNIDGGFPYLLANMPGK